MNLTTASIFVRDRFTWLAYLMLGYYAYVQATLGPLMPFLRSELNLNYTIAGLHLSAFALGMVLAGLFGERAAQRWGRHTTFWGGAVGMAAGVLVLVTGRHEIVTIAGAFAAGVLGSFLLVMIQAALSDRHGERRAIALTESNVAASISASFAPLLIGTMQRTGIGWRGALVLAVAALAVIVIRFQQQPIPESALPAHMDDAPRRALPTTFWLYWATVLFSVAIEWCMIFWGADFLEKVVGLSKIDASTLMTLFFVGTAAARLIGSRLARIMPSARLLVVALAITLGGFLLFWLAPVAPLNVVGLFVTGLGVANLYPLTLSVTTSLAPERANIASARTSMASGLAILVGPQILGAVADQLGINRAYGVVPLLVGLALALTIFANQLAARPHRVVS
jgi:MFS family permease